MQPQMVNFENHQFDAQNESVNPDEDIEPIAKKNQMANPSDRK